MSNKSKSGGREIPGSKYKTNNLIRFTEVRVIEGIENGVYKTEDALAEASSLGLDLVLINEASRPPICKIVDFSKFLYKEKQKEKEHKDKQFKIIVKEIQFSPNIGEHDYETKKKSAVKFLEKGFKVKATVFFKGRTIMFKDRGELVLAKLASEMEDVGIPEEMPKMVGKNMSFIIKPKKTNK